MTVAELIEKLKALPQDAVVEVHDGGVTWSVAIDVVMDTRRNIVSVVS